MTCSELIYKLIIIFLPFSLFGWNKDPLSPGFCLSPSYAPIWCRLENLSSSSLCLLNFGIRSTSPSTTTISTKKAATDIPTTCLVVKDFFDFLEFDSFVGDGPSACFPGVFWESGALKNGGAGPAGGGFNGDVGGGSGAVVVLNGFPSFLHSKLSILGNRCANWQV